MMNSLPLVPLADIFKPVSRAERVDPEKTYRILGAHWYAAGLYVKDTLLGSQIRADKVYRVEKGDFVYNRLFAWKGSFAVATEANAGCYVSNEFPCFAIKQSRADAQFLWRYFSRVSAWEEALGLSTGGTPTSRNRLKEEKFLAMKIPLPQLPEQRRIVARIEELAAKINEARDLRNKAAQEAAAVFDVFLKSVFDGRAEVYHWPRRLLPEVASVARGKFAHRPRNEPRFYGGKYPFIQIGDISSSNRYIRFYSQTLNEEGVVISRLFPAGTVVIAITGATIGVTGILSFDACFPDSIVGIQAKPEQTTSEFIYLAVEHAKRVALAEATQTTQLNINLGNLERLEVYVPALQDQRRIVAELDVLQEHLDALKSLQAKTAAELGALLPSILDKAFKGKL